jgi:thioredoxin 1
MRMMNRRWLAVVAILGLLSLVTLVATGCEVEEEKTEPTEKTTERDAGQPDDRPSKFDENDGGDRGEDGEKGSGGEIIKSDQASFDTDVLQSEVPVLVDFTADWCPPCRELHPTLEELAAEYDGLAKVVQVDVDENGALAREYDVRGIPALFVIKNGAVVDETVGLQRKADLKRMLDKHVG